MRCLILSVVAIGIVVTAGAANGQDEQAQSLIPEDVRKALEWRIGSWEWVIEEEDVKGIWTYRWTSGKLHIIGEGHTYLRGNRIDFTEIINWDGLSEDGLTTYWTGLSMNQSIHSKVISSTVEEGEFNGASHGARTSGHVRTVRQGPDEFTIVSTERKRGDESLPNETIVFTRINPTGRGDANGTEQALERNKTQVRRFHSELYEKKNPARIPEIISKEMRFNGRSEADAHKGVSDLLSGMAKRFDAVENRIEDMVAEGNWVATRSILQGNYYPGANAGEENAFSGIVNIKLMNFFELDENGLIIQNFQVVDGDEQIKRIDAEYARKKQQ